MDFKRIELIGTARNGDFMPLLAYSAQSSSDFCSEWRHCLLGDYGSEAKLFAQTHSVKLTDGAPVYEEHYAGNPYLPAVCYRDRTGEKWAAHFHYEMGDVAIRHFCQE